MYWWFLGKIGYLIIEWGGKMEKRLTYLKAIQKYCRWCMCWQNRKLDELCNDTECPLYYFRHGKNELPSKNIRIVICGESKTTKNYTPLKAIKQRCLDCSHCEKKEIKNCQCYEGNEKGVEPCPLWVYRLGKNPYLKGKRGSTKNFKHNKGGRKWQ